MISINGTMRLRKTITVDAVGITGGSSRETLDAGELALPIGGFRPGAMNDVMTLAGIVRLHAADLVTEVEWNESKKWSE